ncbi:UNKNOWN [Stylonychia lemnae]|uniref:Uncharacterized protein n=1 Tax=Stylonychia lemnae TaxID=5949 RepID=A0A078BBA9_STYLE|nr:UNKNOWN [Stylonychia lemnae]|eukprot:CDW91481.1 UNKNOWN [Stylonychia lemnae]
MNQHAGFVQCVNVIFDNFNTCGTLIGTDAYSNQLDQYQTKILDLSNNDLYNREIQSMQLAVFKQAYFKDLETLQQGLCPDRYCHFIYIQQSTTGRLALINGFMNIQVPEVISIDVSSNSIVGIYSEGEGIFKFYKGYILAYIYENSIINLFTNGNGSSFFLSSDNFYITFNLYDNYGYNIQAQNGSLIATEQYKDPNVIVFHNQQDIRYFMIFDQTSNNWDFRMAENDISVDQLVPYEAFIYIGPNTIVTISKLTMHDNYNLVKNPYFDPIMIFCDSCVLTIDEINFVLQRYPESAFIMAKDTSSVTLKNIDFTTSGAIPCGKLIKIIGDKAGSLLIDGIDLDASMPISDETTGGIIESYNPECRLAYVVLYNHRPTIIILLVFECSRWVKYSNRSLVTQLLINFIWDVANGL